MNNIYIYAMNKFENIYLYAKNNMQAITFSIAII